MSEKRSFERRPPEERIRRGEWVELDDGPVWVREMTVKESMILTEKASRPSLPGVPKELQGGMDATETALWEIICSCFEDDGPSARALFAGTPEDVKYIYSLRLEEQLRLTAAIKRVNGITEEQERALEAFISPSGGGNPSPSQPSASGS